MARMSSGHKEQLHRYLMNAREAVMWKVEGLSEYDIRRPLTPTGTNLLGLVKHLAVGEASYFGQVFARPFEPHLPWWDDDQPEGVDLWATASESRSDILGTYRAAIAHADATISELDLDASGHVPWWSQPDVTLHAVMVHVLAETSSPRRTRRHPARAARRFGGDALRQHNLPAHDEQWWSDYRAQVEAAARAAEAR